jgi:hypothetical protein
MIGLMEENTKFFRLFISIHFLLKLQKQLHVKIVTSFLGMKNLRYGRLSYAHTAMIIENKDNKKRWLQATMNHNRIVIRKNWIL